MYGNVVTDLYDLVSAGSRFGTIYADPPWRYNWRNSHEIMLTATRGNPPPFATDEPGHIICPRSRHSAKPERVRHMIERSCPGPRLELFGRRAIPGWTVFGDTVERDLLSPAA